MVLMIMRVTGSLVAGTVRSKDNSLTVREGTYASREKSIIIRHSRRLPVGLMCRVN